MFLDNQNRLISFEKLFSGTIDGASVYPREVVKLGLFHNAAAVVFAHNHPSGCPEPSALDKALTKELKQIMDSVEITMIDHIIVCGPRIWSFLENGEC